MVEVKSKSEIPWPSVESKLNRAEEDVKEFRQEVKEHLAFGKGDHFCIGAPLSRLEGRLAFEELVMAIELPCFSEGTTFKYEPSYVLRGLAQHDLDVKKR